MARQETECRRLAAAKGWEVVEPPYVDNDVSASSGVPRPACERLLTDIRAGRVNGVVVFRLDRLHRRPIELEPFMKLADDHHVSLASVDGNVNLATSDGRLHARVMGAVASHESEVTSDRIRSKLAEVASKGAPHGGVRPYGFLKDKIHLDEHEADVIREVVAALLAGQSLRGQCAKLNERGDQTPTGRFWEPSVMSRMLQRPRLAGFREHNGALFPAQWEAIISRADHVAIRALLGNPARRRNVGAPGRHLLSGLLRCGVCGARLIHWVGWESNRRSYVCPPKPRGHQCVGVVADPLEELVTRRVLMTFGRSTERPIIEGVTAALADASTRDRAMLVELAEAYGRTDITMPEYLAARRPIEQRIADDENRIIGEAEIRARASRHDLRERWPNLSIDERREAIRTVVDRIVVNRSGRTRLFHPERVRIVWTSLTDEQEAAEDTPW